MQNFSLNNTILFRVVKLFLFCSLWIITLQTSPSEAITGSITKIHSLIKSNNSTSLPDINEHFQTSQVVIPDYLKEGNIFKQDNIEKTYKSLQKQAQVVEVPNWLYGTWKSEKQTQDFIHIFGGNSSNHIQEIPVETIDKVGDLRGPGGQVYSIVIPGIVSIVNKNINFTEYQIILSEKRNSPLRQFVCHDLALRVQVNPTDNTIIKSFWVESEKIYRLTYQPGVIVTDGWLKSFDSKGEALTISHSWAEKKLLEKQELVDIEELDFEKASDE